jgi:hypothetical protein
LKQWKIDLMAARTQWIEGARTDQDRVDRNKPDFLKYLDKSGRQADFRAGQAAFNRTPMRSSSGLFPLRFYRVEYLFQ